MIDNQRETQHELEVELDKKDKLIKENEYNYKRQKMKYLEEMRHKNQDIEDYKAKLESASNNVAYLTNELLKYKKMLHSASNQASADQGQNDSAYAPAPPKEARSHPKRSTLHIRRSLNDPAPDLKPVRKSSGGSNRSESPAELVKPFLRGEIENEADIHIKQTNPLPPIRTSSGRVVFNDQVDVAVVSVHAPSKSKSSVKQDVKPSRQEVETLAVGHLSHSASAWGKRTQESKSSEYH